jgi:hypothetical protein
LRTSSGGGIAFLSPIVPAGPGLAAGGEPACAADRAAAPALCVVQERAYREGVFLIVHALVE